MKINKIKKLRQEKGFMQKEFANKAKISIRALQNYESGERIPDVHTAIRIAKELGVTTLKELEDLFEIPQRELRETSPQQNNSSK